MLPFKRILFPIDFSKRCSEAGVHVAAMVRHFKAELTLLHVVDAMPLEYYGVDPAMSAVAAYGEMMVEERQRDLNSFLKDKLLNLSVKRVLQFGDAATVIIEYARANDIQLIMLPTHGYGLFRSFLLGSVTAKILHDVKCPVWTDVHLPDGQPPREAHYRSILCAVDLNPDIVPVMRSAAELAQEFGAVLRLVHAVPAVEARPAKYLDTEFRHFLFESARADVDALQRKAGIQAWLCLEGGEVSKIVRAAALHHEADLVVIGRGRTCETLGRLRTHSYAIIRESPCPALST